MKESFVEFEITVILKFKPEGQKIKTENLTNKTELKSLFTLD